MLSSFVNDCRISVSWLHISICTEYVYPAVDYGVLYIYRGILQYQEALYLWYYHAMKQIAPPIFILLALFTYYVLQRFVFGARNVGLHPLCKHDSTRHHEQHQQFPLVSVIIPYGKSKRVEAVMQAIDSAVNQTYPNVEVIVVDVSGNQILQETVAATPELLLLAVNDDAEENGYQRSIRVLTVKQPNDTFAGFVRNVGVKASSGEYLAFLDSDDAYLPEKLSKHFEHAHLYDSDFEFSATEAYFSLNCRVSGNTGLFTPWNFSATASRVEEQRKQFIKYNGEKFKKGLGGTKMVRDGASLPGLWDLQLLEWHNCVITR